MRQYLRSPIVIALLVVLAFGWSGFGDIFAHLYWNNVYKHASSAFELPGRHNPVQPVLVTFDERNQLDTPGAIRLLDALQRQGAARVFLDADVPASPDPPQNEQLAARVRAFGPAFAFVARPEKAEQDLASIKPAPAFLGGSSRTVVSLWELNFLHFGVRTLATFTLGGQTMPSFSVALAGIDPARTVDAINPDFSIPPDSIPRVSADALLAGRTAAQAVRGRVVVVSALDRAPSVGYFGQKLQPPLMLDIAAAAALSRPFTLDLGFVPLLALALALVLLGHRCRGTALKILVYGTLVVATFVVPVWARKYGVAVGPEAAMVLEFVYGGLRGWQLRVRRIRHTNSSGLPNLLALTATTIPAGRDVIVAAVARYEEILATLPMDLHAECARQIARRLAVGSGESEIYQGDGGHFAWSEEARPLEMQFSHLEGLRALFAAPLQIGDHTFDTNIHFGLDRNEGLDALTRVNSALASANEALANGRAVELFEAHRLADAPWELSLHARIDEGLRNGDIWLAFQSQWNLAQNRICGAEALIRWNHPTRGPIAPDAFILQAERAGRIDALTYWVLEQAITAALELNAMGPRFQMSVNLSAQMVDKADLVTNFGEIVRRRGIEPALLTIEITETSSVRNRPAACHNLSQLRAMGFRLSIDDFGTGEASLAYLADLPSDELKIDRRFIAKLTSSERDRTIVQNTIALAHALHQEVVAEGIEDSATFNLLRDLRCDLAQGFYLGKPQPFAIFRQDYESSLSLHARRI